jgi:HTH-type transcriptional regulator/antitoxin HipB
MLTITHANQVGATLVARRKTLKLSQSDVAAKLGLSQNRVSELESSPETITVQQLLVLLKTLGLVLSIDAAPGGPPTQVEW